MKASPRLAGLELGATGQLPLVATFVALGSAAALGFLAASEKPTFALVLLVGAGLVFVLAVRQRLDWAMIALLLLVPFYTFFLAKLSVSGVPLQALNLAQFGKA